MVSSPLLPLPLRSESGVVYGVATPMSPLVRRIVAANAGSFTYHGTGTFIIGHGEVAIIDPGPALEAHVDALCAALEGETVTHIVVTHTHRDHSPAARLLRRHMPAPTYGFGPHGGGLTASADDDVEEGADYAFIPDHRLVDGDQLHGTGWSLTALHTPGHTSNHLCFALEEEKTLFSGDHVMGWSSTVISPPDGCMGDYLASLQRLLDRDDRLYRPTHGAAIEHPQRFVAALLAHRADREEQIVDALKRGVRRIDALVADLYHGLDPALMAAAARSVYAHILHLIAKGQVRALQQPCLEGDYVLLE